MSSQVRLILLAVAAVIVFVTGFLLTRTARPYSTGLLTVHKLVDLAGIVFVAVLAIGALRAGETMALDWVLVIAALLLALATLASGGVVSASENVASWILVAHRVLPWPLLLLLGLAVHRFASGR